MDLSRYAELFLTESREHIAAINQLLLELEATPDATEPVGAIFRSVHTVKGMSATMGYRAVADLAHELESLLDGMRRGEQQATPPVMDALFEAADVMEAAIEGAVSGRPDDVETAPLLERLRSLSRAGGDSQSRRVTGEFEAVRATGEMPAVPVPEVRPAPDGSGADVTVRVRLAGNVQLKGARAYLAVKKTEAIGRVVSVSPPVEALQAEQFDREFTIRLHTGADHGSIERVIRAVGDVERVDVRSVADVPGGARAPVAAAQGAGGGGGQEHRARGARNVRMDLRRLDTMMNMIGELVITRGRLVQLAMLKDDPALTDAVTEASRLISDLQDEIMASRMVPVWQVFDRFPRMVRDAGRSLGKQIDFRVEGKEINLDRSMLDEIGDPVVHLLRNAVDHGLETPAERMTAGKPPAGRLVLSAARERSSVTIRVIDDGRGIDRQKVLVKAQATGLLDGGKSDLSDDELIRLISRPGFSTAERVTDISGRGVGIDAVHARIRSLGGSVEIKTTPGRGTTVTLRLPLTLAILRALLVRVEGETYAVPMTHVNETVELEPVSLRTVKGHEVLMLRDDVMPLVRFRSLLRLGPAPQTMPQVIVLEVGERRAGLVVDELAGQQDIVVKQFDGVRNGAALFSGATILGDGAPALIVDVGSLL